MLTDLGHDKVLSVVGIGLDVSSLLELLLILLESSSALVCHETWNYQDIYTEKSSFPTLMQESQLMFE